MYVLVFEGEICEVDINECASNPCGTTNSYCEDWFAGYQCHCGPGFKGRNCEIPDLEACGPGRCTVAGGACQWNGMTHYLCSCSEGWTGNDNCRIP
jgi:hypothetical protein